MADYGLTATGFRRPTEAELQEDYRVALRAAFGPEVDYGPHEVWGHFLGIESERLVAAWMAIEAVYNATGINSAEGVGLDRLADYSNIRRRDATYSLLTGVVCSGSPGVFIAAGKRASVDGGENFETLADATIGLGGTVSVDFQAVNSGAVRANAGTLDTIETAVANWTGVSNPTDAQLGSPIQGDSAFRTARSVSLRIIGESTFGALATQIVDPDNGVEGISDILLVQNVTDDDNTPTGGLPPHSYEFTIEGGTDQDIVDKIFEIAPAGIQSYTGASGADAITGTAEDQYGNSHTVEFSRRAETSIWMHVRIEVAEEFDTGTKQSDLVEISGAVTATYTVTINGVAFEYEAVTTGAISAFSDAGGGFVNVTSVGHGIPSGTSIEITGTANYDAVYPTVTVISADVFQIAAVWAVTETGNWTKGGGADTAVDIAASLTAAINGAAEWVPVLATHDLVSGRFTLTGDYDGVPFVVTATPTASIATVPADHVAPSGDQQEIINNIVDKAEGTATIDALQKIGSEVYVWKYLAPVGDVSNVIGVTIYAMSSQPTVAPIGAGWSTADIDIDNRHKALFDSTRITVEVV